MSSNSFAYIIDLGSSCLKCGTSNDNYPTHNIPTIVGRPILQSSSKGTKKISENAKMYNGFYVGKSAEEMAENLEVTYPVKNGIVVDQEGAENVFKQALFEDMKIANPSKAKIMLTQAHGTPVKHTEFLLDLFLNKFGFQQINISTQATLTLIGSGYSTGLVIDCGAGVSHVVPIWENQVLNGERLDIAGSHVTNQLMNLLRRKGYPMNFSADYNIADKIKQQYCFVANNVKDELRLTNETTFNDHYIKTPIGQINLTDESFLAPEILFDPSLYSNDSPGIAEMIFNCIQDQPVDLRLQLYKCIVMSGGTTMTTGIRTRIDKEMRQLSILNFGEATAAKQSPRIVDNPNRMSSVFIGAKAFFQSICDINEGTYWITKEQLNESGAQRLIKNLNH